MGDGWEAVKHAYAEVNPLTPPERDLLPVMVLAEAQVALHVAPPSYPLRDRAADQAADLPEQLLQGVPLGISLWVSRIAPV